MKRFGKIALVVEILHCISLTWERRLQPPTTAMGA